MKDFEIFKHIYGIPLTIGLQVKINPTHSDSFEWPDSLTIIGMDWNPSCSSTNITVSEDIDNDRGIDGFSPHDLVPL